MIEKQVTDELFYPSPEAINKARAGDWDALRSQAELNLE